MGGDHAPRVPIAGALLALAELPPQHSLLLVGRRDAIATELEAQCAGGKQPPGALERITIIDAPDVIDMSDKPSAAIRAKPNSSMVVGLKLHASGTADAFVSAGNTGAQMAASIFLLKLHGGLSRPAIAAFCPTPRKPLIVLGGRGDLYWTPGGLEQF